MIKSKRKERGQVLFFDYLIVPTLRVGMPVLGAPAPRNLPPEGSSTGVPTPERGNHHNVISVDARRFLAPDG